MNSKVVIDTRNILDKKAWQDAGAVFPVIAASGRNA
jgi:hypothetical protein